MKNILKKFSTFLLFAVCVIALQDFCQKRTQGFSLSKAKSASKEYETLNLSIEEKKPLELILNQPFHFMKKGLQCYAFESSDGKYVLKLLRWKQIEAPFFIKFLPFSWTRQTQMEKRKKKEHDFTSYHIAFNELKEDTGLIYLHLKKTKGLNISLPLYDAIEVKHLISLDDYEFILQKKTDLFSSFFEENKESEKMRSFLKELASVLKHRIENKISDSDISLEYNMGVVEGLPVLYDIGNLTRIETSDIKETLKQEARLVLAFLHQKAPELGTYFEQELGISPL